MSISDFAPVLVAVGLSAFAIILLATLSRPARAAACFGLLGVIVGIYVGFAIPAADELAAFTAKDWARVGAEFTLAAIIMALALGAVLSPARQWLLGPLIVAHGGIDLAHLVWASDIAPDWYAFACIIFDVLVGTAAAYLLIDRTENQP